MQVKTSLEQARQSGLREGGSSELLARIKRYISRLLKVC